jgi:uncharacterized protein involved in exopolysaccharide biosynthesis
MVNKPSQVNNEAEVNDEIRIDLMKYVETLVRQWHWIVACALVLGALVAVITIIVSRINPSYRASALVSSAKTVSSVNFGSAITSQSETDLASAAASGAQALYDRTARLQSYVVLVKNGDVVDQVLQKVGPKLKDPEKVDAAALLRMIDAQLVEKTDTIRISATYGDPAIAADLANAWADAYVQKINELYGSSPSNTSFLATEQETVKAKAAYEAAQKALDDFTAKNKIEEYKRQIEETTILITSLRGARSTATSTIVDQEVAAEQQVINELYKAQASNQLLALEQDQEARRQLISAYIKALSDGRQDVFNQQTNDRLARLDRAYADRRKIGLFLDNAIAMREAVYNGGDAAARSNALALALLKSEIYAAFEGTNTLQVQNLPETLGTTIGVVDAAGMVTDLDALISTLKTRQTDLSSMISTLTSQIQDGTDLNVDTRLESAGALAQEIQARYPELFELGKLSTESLNISASGSQLATETSARSQALLQLKGLENLAGLSYAGTPMEKTIEDNEQKVRDLNAVISSETSTLTVLTRERDLAWTTYSALQTKSAEMGVATRTTGIEVVFSSPATPPDLKTVHGSTNGMIGALVGLGIGLVTAYIYEFWQNYKRRRTESILYSVFTGLRDFSYGSATRAFFANLRTLFTRKSAAVARRHK